MRSATVRSEARKTAIAALYGFILALWPDIGSMGPLCGAINYGEGKW